MAIRIRGIDEVIRSLPRYQNRLQTAARKLQQSVAKEMFTGIVQRTPVDSGFAMASWRLNTGAPLTSTANKSEYKARSSRGQISRSAARSKALDYATKQLNNIKNRENLASIHISSSVNYISLLENASHSQQAPNGMVRVTRHSVIEKFKALQSKV